MEKTAKNCLCKIKMTYWQLLMKQATHNIKNLITVYKEYIRVFTLIVIHIAVKATNGHAFQHIFP